MDIMKVLADHGLIGKSGQYYRIVARRAFNAGVNERLYGELLFELTDDGGVITLAHVSPNQSLRRLNNKMEVVYDIDIGSQDIYMSAVFNRSEEAIYILRYNVLYKRRLSDGSLVWSKNLAAADYRISVNSTGIYVLTDNGTANSTVAKYTLLDFTWVWGKSFTNGANSIQVADSGEVFGMPRSITGKIQKISSNGMTVSDFGGDEQKEGGLKILPGFNYLFYRSQNNAWYYTLSGQGPQKLVASSQELGRDYAIGPSSYAIGKNYLFVSATRGNVLVFKRSDLSLVDKVACSAAVVSAMPGRDDIVTFSPYEDMLVTKYQK